MFLLLQNRNTVYKNPSLVIHDWLEGPLSALIPPAPKVYCENACPMRTPLCFEFSPESRVLHVHDERRPLPVRAFPECCT